MSVRVGINGFGRIGRQSLTALLERAPDIEVVAVNDIVDVPTNALLFKHDSTYGAYAGTVEHTDDAIITGVLESQAGLIERRVRNFAGSCRVRVLVDGGNAAALLAALQFDPRVAAIVAERDLVLRGVLLRARAAARGPWATSGTISSRPRSTSCCPFPSFMLSSSPARASSRTLTPTRT